MTKENDELKKELASLRAEVEKKQAFIDHMLTHILPPGWKDQDHGYVVAGQEHDRVRDELFAVSQERDAYREAIETEIIRCQNYLVGLSRTSESYQQIFMVTAFDAIKAGLEEALAAYPKKEKK